MRKNINYENLLNLSIFILIIFFCYSYFSKINYIVSDTDEIAYLTDSILLVEGIRPSMSHSPSGLSTWIGAIFVIFDFVFNKLAFSNLEQLFQNFDEILYKNYKDLTHIKITLFLFNTLLLFYLLFIDKKKILSLLFLSLYFSPALSEVTFSAKPYFTGSILFFIALIHKDKNKMLSLIFYGLAVAEKLELILLINLIASENYKFSIKNYFLIAVTFFVTCPWFTVAIIPNIKTLIKGFLFQSDPSAEFGFLMIISVCFLILHVILLLAYGFLKKDKYKITAIFIIILSLIHFLYIQKLPIRWLMPGLIILLFHIHPYLLKKTNVTKSILIFSSIIFLLIFNNKNYISQDEIMAREINSEFNNVISYKTLNENLSFKKYNEIFRSRLNKSNIKNINFFKSQNAPLSFGEGGNIEKKLHRRYEFLAKYNDKSLKEKFLVGYSGLYLKTEDWCKILNKENVSIIYNKKVNDKCKEN